MSKYDSYIVGYYGMKNSGDDALMRASLWGVKHRLKHRKTMISTASNITINKELYFSKNQFIPQNFKGQNRFKHYESAFKSNSIVFGGGSVLHSSQDINIKRHMMKLSNSKNSIAAGIGIEKFKTIEDEKACIRFLNECGTVRLRDIDSYKIAKSLAPTANIELAFDLAPLLLCEKNLNLSNLKKKGVAINLCPVAKDSFGNVNSELEDKRVEKIVHTIESIWNATGELIILIDFNGHHLYGDNTVHRKIIKKLNPNIAVEYISYEKNPFKLLKRLSSFKVIIGMRLHAAIMSYLVETPVIPINYHPKCRGWCEQIGIPEEYQFDANHFDSEEMARIVIDNLEQGFQKPLLPIKRAIELALKNWND